MLVVSQCFKSNIGLTKGIFCHRETISVARYHANNLTRIASDGLNSLQTAATCRDKVFYNDDFHAGFQVTFYQVL